MATESFSSLITFNQNTEKKIQKNSVVFSQFSFTKEKAHKAQGKDTLKNFY